MAITCARGVYVVENWLYKPGGDPAADWTGLSKQCRKDRILGAPIDSTVSGELVWRRSWSRLTGVQEVTRRFYCWGCFSAICDLPLDCPGEGAALGEGRGLCRPTRRITLPLSSPGCDGEARGSGFVFLYRGLPVARIGDHLFLEIRGRRCESGQGQLEGFQEPVLLPGRVRLSSG